MKARTKKLLLAIVSTPLALVLSLSLVVLLRQNRKFQAPFPDLHASQDPAVIARGRYLAYGLSHCVDCHSNPSDRASFERGEAVPLSGGQEFKLPLGIVRSRNITPDRETGIGRYSDPEIARILRYGVHADGRVVLPFMPFADLTDADLVALLSFLRSQPPVRHEVPPNEPNFLGKAALAFVIEPAGPSAPPKASITPAPSAEYGRYLAMSVGNCVKCHTKIDMRTGKFAGPLFGGGAEHPSSSDPDKKYVSPNLTPDARWGWLEGWTEEAFVARFHAGPVHADSPMPWRSFRGVTDDDARALYRFLKSLKASAGGPDPQLRNVLASAQASR